MRLTPNMREALTKAKRDDGLRRVHDNTPGKPHWPAHPSTLRALQDRELLQHDEIRNRKAFRVEIWKITDKGREALDPKAKIRPDTIRRLHLRAIGGTRHFMAEGVWEDRRIPEPEPMEPASEWAKRSAARHANAVNRKERARKSRAA